MGFHARSEDEQAKAQENAGKVFGKLSDDDYIFEVLSMDNKGEAIDTFSPPDVDGKYRTYTDVRYKVKPIAFADDPDAELVDENDEPVDPEKYLTVFFKPERLGFGPAGPSKNRQFIAAVLGVPVKGSIDFDLEDPIGKSFVGSVEKNKKGYDSIVGFKAMKAKAERRRRMATPEPAPDLTQAANEIFGDDDF